MQTPEPDAFMLIRLSSDGMDKTQAGMAGLCLFRGGYSYSFCVTFMHLNT